MWIVAAPARLHFGLLSLPSADAQPAFWPDVQGEAIIPARHFGGVGLMVRAPALRIVVHGADRWSAVGPLADRALLCARTVSPALASFFQAPPPGPFHIEIEQAPPEHHGLGSGTQLALAVARAVTAAA